MAEQEAEEEKKAEESPAKPSLLPKVAISGFISFVVVVETCLFFFMVPSAEDVAALAESRLIDSVESSLSGEDTDEDLEGNQRATIKMGKFGDTFIPPGSDRQYRVEYELGFDVYKKDEEAATELLEAKRERLLHHIMLEIRSASHDELIENSLGLLRRRILATTTEVIALGEDPDADIPQIVEVLLPKSFEVTEE